jgi:1-aminocyclopropane-1-carboxylate deaminase/D-cysteine desulfhydrase-like pyridoxal-dependent ACC family enzyme
MPRLRAAIGQNCPRLFIKRDDYSGFGFGGNKVRTLEYVFGRLQADGVRTVVTMGGDRSNHVRVTAFGCARLGIRCILVLDKKPRPAAALGSTTATVYLSELLGAEVHVVDSIEARNLKAEELARDAEKAGTPTCLLPLGGAVPVGALGFVSAMDELAKQQGELGLSFSNVHFASSGAGTHTGMLVGAGLFGFDETRFTGIAPEPAGDDIKAEIKRFVSVTENLLDMVASDQEIDLDDSYAGPGYCEETAEATEAIKLVAQTEGILLDPVYTGKSMAALIDRVKAGRYQAEENVLFWHTGGQPTSFYAMEMDE